MYAIQMQSGRYFASFGTLRHKRYTDNLCNYWTNPNIATAKAKAQKLSNETMQTLTIRDLDSVNTWIVKPH